MCLAVCGAVISPNYIPVSHHRSGLSCTATPTRSVSALSVCSYFIPFKAFVSADFGLQDLKNAEEHICSSASDTDLGCLLANKEEDPLVCLSFLALIHGFLIRQASAAIAADPPASEQLLSIFSYSCRAR